LRILSKNDEKAAESACKRLVSGGGVLPYKNCIGVCAAPNGGVFEPFWSENGYKFCLFWSERGMVERTTVVHECVHRFTSK